MTNDPPPLPRLLYAGDVPVEASAAGALLLHRLLVQYPPGTLRVRESNLGVSRPERRLPGVDYGVFSIGRRRLLHSRLHAAYSPWLIAAAGLAAAPLADAARNFGAGAILTVAHGYGWLAAAAAARRLNLPLHLIVHDDWAGTVPIPRTARPLARQVFGRVYRAAASRLCVSPGMTEEYARVYGAAGEVLYPSRGPDSPVPRVRRQPQAPRPFTVAYAGSLWNRGFVERLEQLALRLARLDGWLDLYTDTPSAAPEMHGLAAQPNVRWQGFLPPRELAERWAATTAALFVPGSFLPGEALAMRLLFSSKIVDYTAAGLPLVVWAPEASSAARWSRENPGAALLVTDPAGAGLDEALLALRDDGARAVELARRAAQAGDRDFSHAAALALFTRALRCGLLPAPGAAAKRQTPMHHQNP